MSKYSAITVSTLPGHIHKSNKRSMFWLIVCIFRLPCNWIIRSANKVLIVSAISPGIPQHTGCIQSWDRGVYCRVGDWGDCCRFLHTFSSYGPISQKSMRLRKKAFIKECMGTYKSIVLFLVFANTSTQFLWSGQVWRDRVFMIKYQDKSLVYCHMYFTYNSMFQYKSMHIMSVNKTNPLQRYKRKIDVGHGVYTTGCVRGVYPQMYFVYYYENIIQITCKLILFIISSTIRRFCFIYMKLCK